MLRSEIEAKIVEYLNRTDLATHVGFWFEVAHKDLQRPRLLEAAEATSDEIMEATKDQYCLPPDFRESRQLYAFDIATGKRVRVFNETSIETLRDRREQLDDPNRTIIPQVFDAMLYARWASDIYIWPSPGAFLAGKRLRYDYYRWMPPPLANAADHLTIQASDCILYAALLESAPWLSSDPRMQTWKLRRDESWTRFLGTDASSANSGSLVMRG